MYNKRTVKDEHGLIYKYHDTYKLKGKDMKLLYIAGKLNGDACEYIRNMNTMVNYAERVRQLGCAVTVPCNDFIQGAIIGEYNYDDYFDNNVELMKRCDAIALCPNWMGSKGVTREIEIAQDLKIPVLFDFVEVRRFIDGVIL